MNPVLPDQEQDIVADLNVLGPGDRLRNARLALDIDIAKIANRLHLTTDVVEALERDDYSEMTARVFVRGYLRNYAREVNLSPDSVLEQFDQIWPESERPMKITTPPRLASDSHPGNHWSTIFTWLIVLSGVALFLVWWQGYLDDFLQQQREGSDQAIESTPSTNNIQENVSTLPAFMQPVQSESTQSESVDSSANTAALSGAEINAENPAASQQNSAPAEPVAESGISEPVAQPLDNSTATEAGSASQADNVTSTVTPEGVREITIDQSGETTGQTVTTEEVVIELRPVPQPVETVTEQAPPSEPVEVDPKAVTIAFSGRCWVDIRDSTRNFKLVGEMNEGDSRQLGGQAPYSMIIGNAKAAQISVGGKPYDLKQHTNGNVARLTLRP